MIKIIKYSVIGILTTLIISIFISGFNVSAFHLLIMWMLLFFSIIIATNFMDGSYGMKSKIGAVIILILFFTNPSVKNTSKGIPYKVSSMFIYSLHQKTHDKNNPAYIGILNSSIRTPGKIIDDLNDYSFEVKEYIQDGRIITDFRDFKFEAADYIKSRNIITDVENFFSILLNRKKIDKSN